MLSIASLNEQLETEKWSETSIGMIKRSAAIRDMYTRLVVNPVIEDIQESNKQFVKSEQSNDRFKPTDS